MAVFNRAGKAARLVALATPVMASSLALGGCMSSPTYGTDKTANEQLLTDVTSLVSLQPKRKDPIDYKPRPDLVRPAPGEDMALPAPQETAANATTNPDWPESPEQRRARLNKEITEGRDKPGFESPIIADVDTAPGANSYTRRPAGESSRYQDSGVRKTGEARQQRAEVQARLKEQRQGSETTRKYLSEPPLDYRQAAATAPQDELGEDEYAKERAAKKAARKPGSRKWADWLPF
ncbi:MAG: hypothetical protein AB7I34_00530 [Rhizobiaceae bacterium]